MVDGIPDFLKLTSDERRAGREATPLTRIGTPAYERTETEKLYYESIERAKAMRAARDRIRFNAMRTKAALAKMETDLIKAAARINKWKD